MENHHRLVLSCILLSFCILASPIHCEQQGTSSYSIRQNGTGVAFIENTLRVASSNLSSLTLIMDYTAQGTGEGCVLKINTTSTIPWSKPCPRVSPPVTIEYFWCRFQFFGGDLVLSTGNGTAVTNETYPNPTTLWSSNTSALGAVAWELLDSDIEDLGNLVLYNANNEIVWRNIANNPALESYSCATVVSAP